MKDEKGQALPLALVALAIGALLVTPFLRSVSVNSIASRTYSSSIAQQYSSDAGVEDAIWNLTNGTLAAQLVAPGDTVSYSLSESVNGVVPSISVTIDQVVIASDDLESGGWSGGSGWLDDWYHSGDASITSDGSPYQGTYHLRLRRANGYADRAVDLSGQSNLQLQFWAKATSFEFGEYAKCLVSPDDINWTVVKTWYDTTSTSWASMADAPAKVKAGGALAYDGSDYIYAFRGNDKKDFWRYDITANSWTSLADAPDNVEAGGTLAYDGSSYIYAFRGNDKKDFWRYDITVNSWTSMADAPDKVEEGGALAYDGSSYIYAFRGNDKKDFWRYDITVNSWTSMVDAPDKVKAGGALAYDGSSYIYAFRGNGNKDFWTYDITANSWTSMADAPDKVKEGGALVYDGSSYIYALRGNNKNDFWRYDINADYDDDTYYFVDIDLSPYEMSSEFWIAFDAEMSGTGDYFYVDDLRIVGDIVYEIVSSAGNESTRADIVIQQGNVSIRSWQMERQ